MASKLTPIGKLFMACATGDVPNLSKNLRLGGGWRELALHGRLGESRPALQHAIHFTQIEAARLLLDAGANPNDIDLHGRTALHAAACCSTSEAKQIIALLAEHGADFSIRDNEGHLASDMDVGYFCGGSPENRALCLWIDAYGKSLSEARAISEHAPFKPDNTRPARPSL